MNRDKKKIWDLIDMSKNFVIFAHKHPDGDSIASQIAMGYILKKLKKNYRIILQDSVPNLFRFILDDFYNVVIPELTQIPRGIGLSTQLKADFSKYTAIVFDCADLERVGSFYSEIKDFGNIIDIDHHSGNKLFGGLNYVDVSASSSCEIIYDLVHRRFELDKKLAELLYIGIVTDTRYFSQDNTSAKTHRIISDIMAKGIDFGKISRILTSRDITAFKLFGRMSRNYKIIQDGKIIYSILTKRDFSELKAKVEHSDGAVEFLRSVSGIKAAIIFREDGKNRVKVSMRGKDGFDVFRIARFFNGGGHKYAAAFLSEGSMDTVLKRVLKKVKSYI